MERLPEFRRQNIEVYLPDFFLDWTGRYFFT